MMKMNQLVIENLPGSVSDIATRGSALELNLLANFSLVVSFRSIFGTDLLLLLDLLLVKPKVDFERLRM